MQTLGQQQIIGAHPYIASFLKYQYQGTSWMIQTPFYVQCDVCKHLEAMIEVALILFYSITYLCFGVSEQDFRRSGVVNWLVRGVSVPRHFLNDTNILHIINKPWMLKP